MGDGGLFQIWSGQVKRDGWGDGDNYILTDMGFGREEKGKGALWVKCPSGLKQCSRTVD
jgi:hypothetical protein